MRAARSRLVRLVPALADVVVALWALARARRAVRRAPRGALLALDAVATAAPPRVPLTAAEQATAWRWGAAVRRAARIAPGTLTCLPRAIALQQLLGRAGVSGSRVCVGVRTDAGLVAHAWVERGGVVLGERAAAVGGFVPLAAAGPR